MISLTLRLRIGSLWVESASVCFVAGGLDRPGGFQQKRRVVELLRLAHPLVQSHVVGKFNGIVQLATEDPQKGIPPEQSREHPKARLHQQIMLADVGQLMLQDLCNLLVRIDARREHDHGGDHSENKGRYRGIYIGGGDVACAVGRDVLCQERVQRSFPRSQCAHMCSEKAMFPPSPRQQKSTYGKQECGNEVYQEQVGVRFAEKYQLRNGDKQRVTVEGKVQWQVDGQQHSTARHQKEQNQDAQIPVNAPFREFQRETAVQAKQNGSDQSRQTGSE